MKRKLTTQEATLLTEIAMQRGEKREQSRALPQYAYKDPALAVKFEREKEKKNG